MTRTLIRFLLDWLLFPLSVIGDIIATETNTAVDEQAKRLGL